MTHVLTIAMRARGKQRPRFYKGRTITPPETQAAEDRIAAEWVAAGLPRNLEGALQVNVDAVYAVPASWSKKRKEAAIGTPYEGTPDLDNVWKLCADALNGVAYADDRHIADAGISQKWGWEDSLTITVGRAFAPLEARAIAKRASAECRAAGGDVTDCINAYARAVR